MQSVAEHKHSALSPGCGCDGTATSDSCCHNFLLTNPFSLRSLWPGYFMTEIESNKTENAMAGTHHASTPLLQCIYIVCAPWPSPGQQQSAQGLRGGRRTMDTAQAHTLGLSLLFLHCQELSKRWENARNADSASHGVTSRITFI